MATQAIEADAGRVRVERWARTSTSTSSRWRRIRRTHRGGGHRPADPHPRPPAPFARASRRGRPTPRSSMPRPTGCCRRSPDKWRKAAAGDPAAGRRRRLAAQFASIVAWAALVVATAQLPLLCGGTARGAAAGGSARRGAGAGRVGLLSGPGAARPRGPGPYWWMRHPIYAGLVVGMLGVAASSTTAAAPGRGSLACCCGSRPATRRPGCGWRSRVRRILPAGPGPDGAVAPYSKPPTVLR